jgi:DnaJ-class molecular chaperone
LLACALRSLLSKCTNCGGTGEVETGHIQIGIPFITSCFVCAGERQIFLRECGK